MQLRFGTILSSCLVLFISLTVIGCFRRETETLAGKKPKWLRWTIGREPKGIDWTACSDLACLQNATLTMEGLTRLETQDDTVRAVPALAESWVSPDPLTFIFTLAPNLRWSNGEPLRAEQFVRSWSRLVEHCRVTALASLLLPIKHARELCDNNAASVLLGVEATNARTLIVHLAHPSPLFPLALSHPATWPVPDSPGAQVLGPFILEKWVHGSEMLYRRNPYYRSSSLGIDGIVMKVLESAPLRVQQFVDSGTDFVDDLPGQPIGFPPGTLQVLTEPTNVVVALVFNTSKRPFLSPESRRFFEQAIQREEIIRIASPLPNVMATGLLAFSTVSLDQIHPIEFSPTAARDGFTRLKLELGSQHATLGWPIGMALEEIAENIQAQALKNLDLKLDIVGGVIGYKGARGTTQPAPSLTLVELSVNPFAPDHHLEWFGSQIGETVSHWRSKTFDSALAASRLATTADALHSALKRAEQILVTEDSIVMPLFLRTRISLRNERVRGVHRTILGAWDLHEASLGQSG